MSVAVDANVLLYASDPESEVHPQAQEEVTRLAGGPDPLYVFWPVISAYLRLATHASVFTHPLPLPTAAANVHDLLSQPHVRAVGEDDGFWRPLLAALEEGRAQGNLVSDAHLVALMRQYGVSTIVTRDRDLRRWDGIRVRDPFV